MTEDERKEERRKALERAKNAVQLDKKEKW